MLNFLSYILLIVFNLIILMNFNKLVNIVNISDKPTELRKIHSKPIPSIGGLIILLNLFFFLALSFYDEEIFLIFEGERSILALFGASTLITYFGAYDDKYGISPINKLLILSIIIFIVLLLDNNLIVEYLNFNNKLLINIEQFSIFFSILCFIIFLNAFNMFDGINGQSGCYSIIILIFLYTKNPNSFVVLLFLSITFFLYLNFKNKTFLGDNGSYLLSYLLSCLIIKNYNLTDVVLTVEEIILLMLYPGLDLIRLFVTRSLKGNHPFYPDGNHIHHIIFKNTQSQTKALFINLFCIAVPILIYLYTKYIYASLLLTLGMYLFVYIYFNKKKNV